MSVTSESHPAVRRRLQQPLSLFRQIVAVENTLHHLRSPQDPRSDDWIADTPATRALQGSMAKVLESQLDDLQTRYCESYTALLLWMEQAELSPRQHTLLFLHYVHDMPWLVVADYLHLCERYVYRLSEQAIERLSQCPFPLPAAA